MSVIVKSTGGGGSSVTIDGEEPTQDKKYVTEYRNIQLESLPYEFNRANAIVFHGEIHLLGSNINNNYSKHYKWNAGKWESVSTLPVSTDSCKAILYKGEIHLWDRNKKHYKWDGSAWVSVGTLPYPYYLSLATVFRDELHIMSGQDSSYAISTLHYKWDCSAWTQVGTTPTSFHGGDAVVIDDKIHCVGGNSTKHHYQWDGIEWTKLEDAPYSFPDHAIVLNNTLYVLGLIISDDAGAVYKNYAWNGTSWQQGNNCPCNPRYAASVVFNNEIHLFGGGSSSTREFNRNHFILNAKILREVEE